jgi:hypothetical protein
LRSLNISGYDPDMGRLQPLLLLCCLSIVALSVADDGWWSAAGGIGSFGKSHPTIRMVSEDLKITLHNELDAKVVVTFVFRNEGPATKVTMAFPENYETRTGASLSHFRTWVDGERVKVVRKVTKRSDPHDFDSNGSAAWLKDVRFSANQTRTVKVTYNGWYFGNTSGGRGIEYVLTSGASWKGPIGTCKISVDYSRLTQVSVLYPNLKGVRWHVAKGSILTTTLVNYEPKNELLIQMVPGFWNFTLNGAMIDPDLAERGHYDRYTSGLPSDPLFRTDSFDTVFGAPARDEKGEAFWDSWKSPVCAKFGGPFEVKGNTIKLGNGKTIKLRRGVRKVPIGPDQKMAEFVYLKDVVQALGGKLSYSARDNRVDLRF